MKTSERIDVKRQKLDQLRQSIKQTMGPSHNPHGFGFGLVFAGFALGVMAERWGVGVLAGKLLSVNRVAGFILPKL